MYGIPTLNAMTGASNNAVHGFVNLCRPASIAQIAPYAGTFVVPDGVHLLFVLAAIAGGAGRRAGYSATLEAISKM